MHYVTVQLRFYAELNDFLSIEKQKIDFTHRVAERSAIKDAIESLGVPHTEIDLILVNGKSVDFSYQVKAFDHISVYPVFELFDITPIIRLRAKPLRLTKFILDVHLGKLARYLRLLGLDTHYDRYYDDDEIIKIAQQEKRIILTRDVGILKNKKVTHGHWMRATNPKAQIQEVVEYFDLWSKCAPFTRCLECNGKLKPIKLDKKNMKMIPSGVLGFQKTFFQCQKCKRFYWHGTHYKKLRAFVDEFLENTSNIHDD